MSDAGSPVTLIVKAPNQQIEDLTVECELDWTVRRLKGHLAEVYPNQPVRRPPPLLPSQTSNSDTARAFKSRKLKRSLK